MKTAKHPSGLEINFVDDGHYYLDANGQHYTSVTQLVKRCFPAFDKDTILKRVAEREGESQQTILDRWAAEGREACTFGTRVHEVAEYAVTDGAAGTLHTPQNEKERSAFALAWDHAKTLRSDMKIVGAEAIVFSPRYALAGTIDLLAMAGDTLYILDWKTNKKIRQTNDFGGRGLGELQHLHDCNFEHYALQLNIYRRMLRQEGYLSPAVKRVKMALLYIEPGADAVKEIALPGRMQETAEALLNLYAAPF